MKRIYSLRNEIDKYIEDMDEMEKLMAIRHLYGVADICGILAHRRSLDYEVCVAAGLLHDLWMFENELSENHGKHGAIRAEEVLNDIHIFDKHEIKIICRMIKYHSDKGNVHGVYEELLKDADNVHHYLDQPDKRFVKTKAQRIKRTMRELGLNIKVNKK
ncbi:MAG: HD domain-containing protein [Clostridiales bacterium]|nr:HD domain-containing protein [Clostridiales bacterium]